MSSRERFTPTEQTQVRRKPQRASYDRALAYRILDEALVCSVGFIARGEPHVIPMGYARLDDSLILHGASTSRLVSTLCDGGRICVTVTLLDAVVLARSAMHHSMNYRSVVVFGSARELVERDLKLRALTRMVEHVLPGRSAHTRPPNELELRATRVLALPLEEVSIKQRVGDPIDDAEDLELPYWAGQIPLSLVAGVPIADAGNAPAGATPEVALGYRRGSAA